MKKRDRGRQMIFSKPKGANGYLKTHKLIVITVFFYIKKLKKKLKKKSEKGFGQILLPLLVGKKDEKKRPREENDILKN
jgi:hypothetical protein